jgi:DNA-binding response OmpR family regulator
MAVMENSPLVIFIVDDDASARRIAAFPFDGPDYQVHQFESGEACLAALDQAPDVILLDVEMTGMTGIDTCRALRAKGETRAHVIFISIHNDLETRLRAYDAGGTDYIVKPVTPEELAQKVVVARHILRQQQGLKDLAQQASQTAFTAMSSMGEFGIVLQFLRASFACASPELLARELIGALQLYGLEGLLELRLPGGCCCASSQGQCTQLELSILAHASRMERIFQFHDRLVINYPGITLVASKLPLADEDHVGRLRDNLAILAEGANARLAALVGEAARATQAQGIGRALTDLSAALEVVEQQQEDKRLSVLLEMDQFILELERSFVHLGLSQTQESSLSNLARKTSETVAGLLGDSKDVSDRLHGVAVQLRGLVTPP